MRFCSNAFCGEKVATFVDVESNKQQQNFALGKKKLRKNHQKGPIYVSENPQKDFSAKV